MGEDGFIIFGAKSCLILQNNRGAFNAPPRQLTYIFNPTAQVIGLNPIPKNYQVIFQEFSLKICGNK